jgi:hypothetical protein
MTNIYSVVCVCVCVCVFKLLEYQVKLSVLQQHSMMYGCPKFYFTPLTYRLDEAVTSVRWCQTHSHISIALLQNCGSP